MQLRGGLLHCVAGAELRHLAHEAQMRCAHGRLDFVGTVAGDHHDAVRPQSAHGAQDVLQ